MNSTASTVQIFWAASASIFKLRHCVKGWDQGEGSRGQVIDRDQGDRSLIFFSKKFVNSHNKLYLCSVFAWVRGTLHPNL